MASRIKPRRWVFREITRASVLLAFCAGALVFFASYFFAQPTIRHPAPARSEQDITEQHYTGAILVPTGRPDTCRTITLDNRTGQMMEGADTKCTEAVAAQQPGSFEGRRLREVGKAFRHGVEPPR